MIFQHFSEYKSMGMQIWPSHRKVKGHPRIIIWTNLADLESPMLYTKIQPWAFLVLEKKIFKVFLPYTGMAAILLSDVELFKQTEQIWQNA